MTTNETPLARRAAELLLRAAVLAFMQPGEKSLSLLAQQLHAIREMLPLSSTGAPDLSIIIPQALPHACCDVLELLDKGIDIVLQNVSGCHSHIMFDTLRVLFVENDCHVQLIRLLSHPELRVAERAVSLLEILSRTRRAARLTSITSSVADVARHSAGSIQWSSAPLQCCS
ncbi:Hypothetical protein, putative [Bodo saltans]|uniref:Uncharacterized protein n=1 Tax=Bodo saltans TaxID=75058 RepID=A0A0S4JLU4_BODSA|nr:Hypothetical protein, putative [Bodo saltans]|eukprot:CUG90078.1 Hypothetical protein, putative [Bodo saltans]